MPFFPSITKHSLCINDNKNRNESTLQVRSSIDKKFVRTKNREKRVWASAPWAGRYPAAVSVEAALALSIFIFAMVCMMFPFRMMERQRQVQASLESVNEDLCQYAYLEYMLSHGEEIPAEEGDWKEDLLLGLVHGAARAGARQKAEGMFSQKGMEQLSYGQSAFLEDGETIDFRIHYQMRLPFSILKLTALPFSSASVRRAWIGRDGLSRDGNGSIGDDEDEIVYIGKTSTRYHRSRDCHYLSNQLQTVSFDAVSAFRNQSGGKYYPCAVCGSRAASGDDVLIMRNGSRYHTDPACQAIAAYVQEVKLSEVKHLGGCSYCCRP